ncbi:MAG: hypothetical protein JWM65_3387 [Sphingomonas bacterium]|nr:hypothetical protein [Sphingomonas bacterium]
MNNYQLRQLGPGDVTSMEKLTAMLVGEPDTYGDAPPGHAYLERLLARDHSLRSPRSMVAM